MTTDEAGREVHPTIVFHVPADFRAAWRANRPGSITLRFILLVAVLTVGCEAAVLWAVS